MKKNTRTRKLISSATRNKKNTRSDKFQQQAVRRHPPPDPAAAINGVDMISQLPDDILTSIISRLSLTEAAATSILSTRWRRLWTHTTRLNFPHFEQQRGSSEKYMKYLHEIKFPNYVKFIDGVLDSYNNDGILKEFSIHMPCLEGANVEKWIEFALARKVEIIDISMVYFINATKIGSYSFPWPSNTSSLQGVKSLKELTLGAVDLDDRDIELLISNFIFLERLSILRSQKLRNVAIVGHLGLKLKHLEVSHSRNVESIEICDATSLVSLRCYRLPFTYILRLDNVPRFTEFDTSDQYRNTLADVLPRIPSSIHDQLLQLKLTTAPEFIRATEADYILPKLINLKRLELRVIMNIDTDTSKLFHLIEACPLLEKLEVKFLWSMFDTEFKRREPLECLDDRNPANNHLKEVTFSGYLGCPSELEFALYVLKRAAALEEFIVEPCDVSRRIRGKGISRVWDHFRPIFDEIEPLFVAQQDLHNLHYVAKSKISA
ncbi:hypothetical protein ACP275_03G007500 [Erythranthe tilingii]